MSWDARGGRVRAVLGLSVTAGLSAVSLPAQPCLETTGSGQLQLMLQRDMGTAGSKTERDAK